MKLQQWTLFIDMLGYRDINGSVSNDEDAQEFIDFMESNKAIFEGMNGGKTRNVYKNLDGFNLYEFYEVSAAFISDSIIINFKPIEVPHLNDKRLAMLHSASALYVISFRLQALIASCLAQKGIFLRGGVSNKYAMVKGEFAVGEGLIEAYKAESELAKHPRIILHPEVAKNEALMHNLQFLGDRMYGGRYILKNDPDDGLVYIDYLGHASTLFDQTIPMIAQLGKDQPENLKDRQADAELFFKLHAQALRTKLSECSSRIDESNGKERDQAEKVMAKFEWLKNYHNRTCQAVPELKAHVLK